MDLSFGGSLVHSPGLAAEKFLSSSASSLVIVCYSARGAKLSAAVFIRWTCPRPCIVLGNKD